MPQSVHDTETTDRAAATRPAGAARLTAKPSLRTYLVGPAVLFTVIAVTAGFYQRSASFADARKTATAYVTFAAQLAAGELEAALEREVDQVARTAADPGLAGVFAARGACTLLFSGSGPLTSGHLDIVAADGTVACSSSGTTDEPVYAGSEWLPKALQGPVLRAPELDARTGKQVLTIASPIGQQGALVSFVDLESVGPSLAASFGGPRHAEFAIRSQGETLVTTQSMNRREWFYGEAKLPTTGWTILAGVRESEALRAATTLSNRQLAVIPVATVLAFTILFIVYRRIAVPIARLSAGVRAASDDLTGQRIDIAGPREVSQLVEDFNHLINAAHREREITSLMVELEQRLRRTERTHEQERELRLLDERERIGRDLHDTVIQRLFATGMTLDNIAPRIPDEEVRRRVERAVDEIDVTIREVREAIFDMEHRVHASTRDACEGVVRDAAETLGFEPSVSFVGPVDTAIPSHVADQLLVVMRESLSNVTRHASASAVHIEIIVDTDIAVVIRDDGVGSEEVAAIRRGGLGVASMRARAERLGGSFSMQTPPGGGTRVEWRVPRSDRVETV